MVVAVVVVVDDVVLVDVLVVEVLVDEDVVELLVDEELVVVSPPSSSSPLWLKMMPPMSRAMTTTARPTST